MNDLLKSLKAAINGEADVPPKDFKTSRQWAEEFGKRPEYISRLLRSGIEAGKVEMKVYRVSGTSRGVHPVPHYKIKP